MSYIVVSLAFGGFRGRKFALDEGQQFMWAVKEFIKSIVERRIFDWVSIKY